MGSSLTPGEWFLCVNRQCMCNLDCSIWYRYDAFHQMRMMALNNRFLAVWMITSSNLFTSAPSAIIVSTATPEAWIRVVFVKQNCHYIIIIAYYDMLIIMYKNNNVLCKLLPLVSRDYYSPWCFFFLQSLRLRHYSINYSPRPHSKPSIHVKINYFDFSNLLCD